MFRTEGRAIFAARVRTIGGVGRLEAVSTARQGRRSVAGVWNSWPLSVRLPLVAAVLFIAGGVAISQIAVNRFAD